MTVSHIDGPSVLSEKNLPHVKKQIADESANLIGEISSKERHKTYQKSLFCGRKICAQTTSILCCPLIMTCFSLCNPCSAFACCNYSLIQKRGGWRKWLSVECCPKEPEPAKDAVDLCGKFLDPSTVCRPCQEPAINYSTATERTTYTLTETSLKTLKKQQEECSRINEFFTEIDLIGAPAPIQQIMVEFTITATPKTKLDKNKHDTYELHI